MEPTVCLPANSGIFICATLNLCIKIMIHIIYIYISITSSSNNKKKNIFLFAVYFTFGPQGSCLIDVRLQGPLVVQIKILLAHITMIQLYNQYLSISEIFRRFFYFLPFTPTLATPYGESI